MSGQVPVTAGWAIRSKRPGSRDDYSVLDSSAGPLSAAEFGHVLAHFAPGNPPAESGTPASLPWVTLSRVGVGEETYLGVSLQVPTEDVDSTGRPISRTSYICVSYGDLARDPVTYAGLSEALAAAHLPNPDGAPLPLTVPPLDPAEVARTIMELGPKAVATMAALLLSGPVTITGPDFPDQPTRLRFLDAVAALLPYGYRANYTAATWSDTGAGARFRIVFANRARDEASRVTWGSPARVPAAGPAGVYLSFLQRVLGEKPVDVTKLAALISHLARDTRPRKFEQPERAIASLGEFFRAAVVGETIDAGNAAPTDIRLLFSRGQDQQLTPDQRRKALERLITAADAQDWPLISRRFGEVTDSRPQELMTAIAQTCRRILWSAAPKDLVRQYLGLATTYGLADDLLARLMVPPASPADLASGLDAAGALLGDVVMGGAGPYPETRKALSRNAAAGAALIAHLAASRGQAEVSVAIEWLEPVLDQVLPPFNAVLGDEPEPVDAAALQQLSQNGGPLSVRYLLRAASYLRRLRFVLPGLASWMVTEATRPGAPDRRFWNEAAMELTPGNVAEDAWLDLALLASGNDPRTLLAGRYSQQQFGQCLTDAWRELATLLRDQGQEADELLTGALIDFLGRHPWRTDQAQAAAVMKLASRLTADGARPRLLAVVLDTTEALAQLPRDAAAAEIARVCARACAEGIPPEHAGNALARSGAITSGAKVTEVLEQLRRILVKYATAREEVSSYEWQQAFAAMFANGMFGELIAAQFAASTVKSASEQLAYNVELLWIAATKGAPGAVSPALSEAETDYLDRIRGSIEELVRAARKRQGGRGWGLTNITGRTGGGE